MKLLLKIIYILIGLAILAVGASTLRVAGLGVDPFTAMNIGISNEFGFSLGNTQLVINIVIFIFVIFTRLKSIGIGTILNMTLVGYFIQFFTPLLEPLDLKRNIFVILLALVVGVLLFTLGATMYMTADLGQAPYDAIAPIISDKTHLPYKDVRIWQDILVLVVAFIVSGPIGLGTIICAFGTGPLITMWTKILPKNM